MRETRHPCCDIYLNAQVYCVTEEIVDDKQMSKNTIDDSYSWPTYVTCVVVTLPFLTQVSKMQKPKCGAWIWDNTATPQGHTTVQNRLVAKKSIRLIASLNYYIITIDKIKTKKQRMQIFIVTKYACCASVWLLQVKYVRISLLFVPNKKTIWSSKGKFEISWPAQTTAPAVAEFKPSVHAKIILSHFMQHYFLIYSSVLNRKLHNLFNGWTLLTIDFNVVGVGIGHVIVVTNVS